MDQRLRKNEKLKSKKLIDQLFLKGQQVKKFPLKLVYLPLDSPQETTCKSSFSVPKKLVKTAVGRNRIKRLMRESFRKNKYLVESPQQSKFAFMFIYLSREKISSEQMTKTMILLLEKFNEKEKSHEKSSQ
ncbi:MAG: ribonuclease P protein component [Salegentibacter sp.]